MATNVSLSQVLTQKVGQANSLISTLARLLLLVIVLLVLVVLIGRVLGAPIALLTIPGNDLTGVGVLLFCAAFALGK